MDDGLDALIDGWKTRVKRKGKWWIHNIEGGEERWKMHTKKEEKLRSESGRSEFYLQEKDGANHVRAIKRIKKRAKRTSSRDVAREYIGFRNEVESLIICQNRTVRHLFSELMYWFEDETAFYVAMKFYPEGSLNSHCTESVYESDGITIMRQVFEGLKFLHSEGIIHADLRSENILVTEGSPNFRIKLCDFSDSVRRKVELPANNRRRTYLAPEVIESITNRQSFTSQTDIYASGILMFWLFTMRLPGLETSDVASEFRSEIERTRCVSRVAAIFMQNLVQKDPLRRPSARDALQSRWILETADWKKEKRTIVKKPSRADPAPRGRSTFPSRPIAQAKKAPRGGSSVKLHSTVQVPQKISECATRFWGGFDEAENLDGFLSESQNQSQITLDLQDGSAESDDEVFRESMSGTSSDLNQGQPQALRTSSTTFLALSERDVRIPPGSRVHIENSSEVKIRKLKAERIRWGRVHDKASSDAESDHTLSTPTPTSSDSEIDIPSIFSSSQSPLPFYESSGEPFGKSFDNITSVDSVSDVTSSSKTITRRTSNTEASLHTTAGQFQTPIETPGTPCQADLGGLIMTYITAGDIHNFRSILPAVSKETLDSTLDRNGRSAFWLAASLNRLEMLRALWEEKAVKVDIVDINGQTVLHGAVQKGKIEAIEYLTTKVVFAKSFWDQKDNNNETALSLARRISDRNRHIISLISMHSGGLDDPGLPKSETRDRLSQALDDIISWKPRAGADMPLPDHSEFERLLWDSAMIISVDQIYKLVSAEHLNDMVLAEHQLVFGKILERLESQIKGSIKEKATELAPTIYNLLQNAQRGSKMEMDFIIESCMRHRKASGFYSALLPKLFICASKNPNEGILLHLLRSKKHDKQITFQVVGPHLLDLISEGNVAAIRIVLGETPSLANYQRPEQDTALIRALSCSTINPVIVKCLVHYGADIAIHRRNDLEGYDYLQRTPLHFAVLMNNVQLLEILLGAERNCIKKAVGATDSSGFTPLLLAAYGSKTKPRIIELLISAGSNPNARDHADERTPLAWAFLNGATSTVQILLSIHDVLDLTAKDAHLHTALYYASISSKPNLKHIKLLFDLLRRRNVDKSSIEEAAMHQILTYAVDQSQTLHALSKIARSEIPEEKLKHLEDWCLFLEGVIYRGDYYYIEDGLKRRVARHQEGYYELEFNRPNTALPRNIYHFQKTRWSDEFITILDER